MSYSLYLYYVVCVVFTHPVRAVAWFLAQEYYQIVGVCTVLMVCWPFGLPAIVAYTFYTKAELIRAKDEDTMMMLDNMVHDYRDDRFYWEVVEFSRKLILMVSPSR